MTFQPLSADQVVAKGARPATQSAPRDLLQLIPKVRACGWVPLSPPCSLIHIFLYEPFESELWLYEMLRKTLSFHKKAVSMEYDRYY